MTAQKDTGKSLVIDCGSGFTKAGLSDIEPSCKYFPTVYGVNKDGTSLYGDDAINKRRELDMKDIFDRDKVVDWDQLREYWLYLYKKELHLEPHTKPVLFGYRNIERKGYKEKILSTFIEEIRSPGFYISSTSLLSLYGSGRIQGVVVDSGHGLTTCVVNQEGLSNEHQEGILKIAGQDINEYIRASISPNIDDREFIRNVKQNKCKLEIEPFTKKKDLDKASAVEIKDHPYILPDGSSVTIGHNTVHAMDILFHPSKCGKRVPGLHELVYESVLQSDYDGRRDLFANIIISGGNFNSPGVAQR